MICIGKENTMKLCPTCLIEHNEEGIFCSYKCSNFKEWSKTEREKIGNAVKNSQKFKNYLKKKKLNKPFKICELCGKQFTNRVRKDSKLRCLKCRQTKRERKKKIINNLYDISSRTRTKIISRLKLSCSRCGWNEGRVDIHHIISKKNNGSNNFDNLTPICPNCHRLYHEGKIKRNEVKSLEELHINDWWKTVYYGTISS